MNTHMLIRSDNVPTELSSEYKIMEGPEDIIREICNILNGVSNKNTLEEILNEEFKNFDNPYYYSIKEINETLYDGYKEIYGDEFELNLKQRFEDEKYDIDYKGTKYTCNLSRFEVRKITKMEV